jgi:general secretion pathway protein G
VLIEILVVLAIVALLAAAVGGMAYKRYRDAQVQTAVMQVRNVGDSITQYMVVKNACPTVDDLVRDQYLRGAPIDPWGTAVVIRCPGEHGPDPADVVSHGPDRVAGTEDDVKSWKP